MSEENESGIFSCKGLSWISGGLLGFALYLIAKHRWEMGFFIALILGVVLTVAVALLLRKLFCVTVADTGWREEAAERAAAAAEADRAETRARNEARAERVAEARAEEAAAEEAAAEAEPAPEPAPGPGQAPEPEPAPEPASAADTTAPTDADQPAAMDAPREGGADDLKMIKGVGPKLEQLLHELGIYHFDQIAQWGPREIAWMDDNLKGFKGRVSRDNWVEQAKKLARGEETEFAKKVKKGDVY